MGMRVDEQPPALVSPTPDKALPFSAALTTSLTCSPFTPCFSLSLCVAARKPVERFLFLSHSLS